MVIGLLTDVFDGILARKLGTSTERLRVLDSNVDQFFWLVSMASIFYMNWNFVAQHYFFILVIAILELAIYLISWIKFKRTVATHSILAKLWTLTLLWFLVELSITGSSFLGFWTCVTLGIISRLEIIAIICYLKSWATDIPSIIAVRKINAGLPVKKFKLFNS